MQLDPHTIILLLIGALQAYFWFDKNRDASERAEMRASIKGMEVVLTKIEKELAVANYALFRQSKGDTND